MQGCGLCHVSQKVVGCVMSHTRLWVVSCLRLDIQASLKKRAAPHLLSRSHRLAIRVMSPRCLDALSVSRHFQAEDVRHTHTAQVPTPNKYSHRSSTHTAYGQENGAGCIFYAPESRNWNIGSFLDSTVIFLRYLHIVCVHAFPSPTLSVTVMIEGETRNVKRHVREVMPQHIFRLLR